jgi:hypothetical protein
LELRAKKSETGKNDAARRIGLSPRLQKVSSKRGAWSRNVASDNCATSDFMVQKGNIPLGREALDDTRIPSRCQQFVNVDTLLWWK